MKWFFAPADSESGGAAAGDGSDDGSQAAPAASPPSLALSAEQVRNSPEFKARDAEARRLARELGTARAAEAAARTQAEEQRAAAEAQVREAQANEIRSILGDEGVADWQNIADLAATDQTAAARAFAQLRGKVLAQNQTQPPTAPPVGSTQPAMAGGGMFPTRGVDANAPLGQPSADNSWAAVAAEAEARFQTQVARQQGSLQDRSRFTGKDRREGIMDYLASAYAKVMGERQASGRR